MTELRTCPACLNDNPLNAAECLHCSEELPPLLPEYITEQVPEKLISATDIQPAREVPRLKPGEGVVLLVRGYDDPIFVSGGDIIIGRYDPGASVPSVDLTPFNGGSLGVSRRHARIRKIDQMYVLEDMGSTNGTWINQTRLPKGKQHGLYSGDVLQLGQLVIYFYADSAEAVRSVHERISFRSASDRLTPQYLATRITPYLNALASVQAVCDEILSREPSSVEIDTINIDGPEVISVRITGARDALRLAKGHLKLWRKEHSGKLSSVENNQNWHELGEELREAEISLAFEFLRDIAPDHAGEDSRGYIEKLLQPLHVLAVSPLYVTTGSGMLAS